MFLPLLLMGWGGKHLHGQDDEEVFELSPFVVSTEDDVGYYASNAISGTSLNTAIRDLPMSLEVLTSELLEDLGATNFEESLSYSSGVFTSDFEAPRGSGGPDANRGRQSQERSVSASAGGDRFANNVTVRGFNVPFQNRMGFRYGGLVVVPGDALALGGIIDTVNVDRMEIVKGPSSLLYGVGVISGIVNMIPKRPGEEAGVELGFRVGSNDQYRVSADYSQPVLRSGEHRLLARAAGAYESRGDWRDFSSTEVNYATFQLDYNWAREIDLLVEYQYGFTRLEGINGQWVYDGLGNAFEDDFRNAFDEQYNWARHEGVIPELGRIGLDGSGNLVHLETNEADRGVSGGGLGQRHRITGPDTWAERKEHHFLLNLDYTPTRELAFSTGLYYNEQDTEEFTVDLRTENNRFAGVGPTMINQIRSGIEPDLLASALARRPSGNTNTILAGEVDDIKAARYYWKRTPQSSESFQWRARATWNFETDLLGGERHTLLAGYHYIEDRVDFISGSENAGRAYNVSNPGSDALHYRDVLDFSPIRYDGETLAMPGREYLHQEIWFSGIFALYQGKFWRDRIEVLGGVRRDEYNASTARYARIPVVPDGASGPGGPFITESQLASGAWGGEIGWVANPSNETFGRSPLRDNFEADVSATSTMLGANFDVTDSLTFYALYSEGISPNTGLKDGSSDTIPAERTKAEEFGFKWELAQSKLSGSVSFYRITRDNAIWNFRYAPAPSRWADADDFRPDGWTGATGGEFDPTPRDRFVLNYGVDAAMIRPEDSATAPWIGQRLFVNNAAVTGLTDPNVFYVFRQPGTTTWRPATGLYRIEDHSGSSAADRRTIYWLIYDQLDAAGLRPLMERAFAARELSADIPGSFDPIRYSRTSSLSGENTGGNNPSARGSTGAFVAFKDDATGMDLEVVWTPSSRFQLRLTYAHTERSAQGAFEMVDFVDLTTGQLYAGTEYDQIVRVFGRAAFGIEESDSNGDGVPDTFIDQRGNPIGSDNPLRPSEAIDGIDGLSLFYNPEDTLSALAKYTFTEGRLEGLSVLLGYRYEGPAQTSIPIGGTDLGENLFRTPETKARSVFDLGVFYAFQAVDYDWTLRLNIGNVLDDREAVTTVSYADGAGDRGPITKRTENFFAPRSFRLSLGVKF
jgi:outer membrane receptor protein involved in Fe transport